MNKHTAGPWAVELPFNEPGVYVTSANPRTSNQLICRLIDQAQAPEGKANARLIAAAPDLLAALEHMLGACDPTVDRADDEHFDFADAYIACDAARAAIAKARGE